MLQKYNLNILVASAALFLFSFWINLKSNFIIG